MAKQTAVTWLYLKLQDKFPKEVSKMYNSNQLLFESLYLKAREMEKDQIIDAATWGALSEGEQYYKENFNK